MKRRIMRLFSHGHVVTVLLIVQVLMKNNIFSHVYGYGDNSDIHIGYQVNLAIPTEYINGFIGRAYLMETDTDHHHHQKEPNFRTSVTVEGINDKYSCSLDVFLGNVKVWSSGHFSTFYTTDKCLLDFTDHGDLQLKGQAESVGWRTGTSGQGVKRLRLLRTGNLVLVDDQNLIKWQSFNFPTNVMLWGQRLSSRTRLTSFISDNNSNTFYSFEIQYDKIALYLISGLWKYSYWEFKPTSKDEQKPENITFVQLTSEALEIFSGTSKKVGEITSRNQHLLLLQPLRFLALSNTTGDLGLYFYSKDKQGFQASFQALTKTCDFPLACKPYGICTFSNSCSCISLITRETKSLSDCNVGIREGLCGKRQETEMMVELKGVTSVLRGIPTTRGSGENSSNNRLSFFSRDQCANSCLHNCTCVAALYSPNESEIGYGECFLYGSVRGVKQVEKGSILVYMVKVQKESDQIQGKGSGLKKWVVILIGVVDGLIILVVLGGVSYYLVQKRTNNNTLHTQDSTS